MENNKKEPKKFGTFGGVFTPNILTILGIILFLRFGWVVGNAGLYRALIMVFIGCAITFLTALSLSAISTNIRVKTGGAYYIISRSLGLEIGGSIGIPLYLSQAISVAFYLIGFAEAFHSIYPGIEPVYIASITCFAFAIIAYIGANFAIKIQVLILAIMTLSLISFFTGTTDIPLKINYAANYMEGFEFWAVFAIFFPAVTGIMSGVSMSGDLKNPNKSIPRGTISAVILSYIVYSAAIYWFAANATVAELQNDMFIMKKISRWPIFFTAGVFAATLSSAIASMVAAPRTLQALSFDKVIPTFFARRLGSRSEPRIGVIFTFFIAEGIILIGNLDLVAPIITMFFLNTYGMLNLAAGFEKLTGNPNYRPKIKIHWSLSFLGALGCYAAMFLIHAQATIGAIVISYAIFFFLSKRYLKQYWGDARSGIWFTVAQFALTKLEKFKLKPKNWKPNIIVFTRNPKVRTHLSKLAGWLSKGNGLISFFHIIEGDVDEPLMQKARKTAKSDLEKFITENDLADAFAEAEIVEDYEKGAITIAQAHGIGKLKPNIALFPLGENIEKMELQACIMGKIINFGCSVMFLKTPSDSGIRHFNTIDLWWGGLGGNDDLMMLLTYLISLNEDWEDADVRVIRMIKSREGIPQAQENIQKLLDDMRVPAESLVLAAEYPGQPIEELISEYSKDTGLTILGMGPLEKGEEHKFAERINSLTANLSSALLVRSSGLGDLLNVT